MGSTSALALLAMFVPAEISTGQISSPPVVRLAAMCFKTGEEISGLNKICYYDCLGSAAAITIKSFALCPLNINR